MHYRLWTHNDRKQTRAERIWFADKFRVFRAKEIGQYIVRRHSRCSDKNEYIYVFLPDHTKGLTSAKLCELTKPNYARNKTGLARRNKKINRMAMKNEHLTRENSWGVKNTRYLVRNITAGGLRRAFKCKHSFMLIKTHYNDIQRYRDYRDNLYDCCRLPHPLGVVFWLTRVPFKI